MRKVFVVLLTLALLVGITGAAYAANSSTTDQPTTIGNGDGWNPYQYSTVPIEKGYGDLQDNVDSMGNELGNANASGDMNIYDNTGASRDKVIKSDNMLNTPDDATVTVQRTHGEYKNNTNSCASCHQTHTGAAENLLIKGGTYETCTACHDGTLGFYDVFSPSSAGTFGGTADGNASVHMANGTIQHKYAPGGNLYLAGTANGEWTAEFDCASCHAPHGSYSDRLLHYNPNNMADTAMAEGGQKLAYGTVYDFSALPAVPASPAETDIIAVRGTAADFGITAETGTTPVIVAMKAVKASDGTVSWVKENVPWLYGSNHSTGIYSTAFLDTDITTVTNTDGTTRPAVEKDQQLTKLSINYAQGYVKSANGQDVANVDQANIARVYVVNLQSTDYPMTPVDPALTAAGWFAYKVNPNVYVKAANGIGVAIGKYCAACHTDYRAKSGSETGMYELAFRHTTNNDTYTCLKCHFAHGTDVTVMADAKDNTVASLVAAGIAEAQATAYLLDKNPSSALKRYTNMSVCWKCHTSSHSNEIKNNDEYWNNYFDSSIPAMNKVPAGFPR